MMFGPVKFIGTLASLAFDIMASISDPIADKLWNQKHAATLEEIAEHLGAIRALAEDTRNLLQHKSGSPVNYDNYDCQVAGRVAGEAFVETFAAPVVPPSTQAAPEGARDGGNYGAGPLNVTSKYLRAAARGLRTWVAGEPCDAPHYWASVANALDNIARTQQTLHEATTK
ncbi:hypothetical protein AWC19_14335 [Mycobacterium palustre]|uniref:Uncharacterized protein n=2 Tax=Mycobacterium palustre TaxID=153971 RepID=A0A1X1ZC98_9MYCO|nr:hypothetical protein AWC19_14335 [Mycobacterium palustre]